MDADTLLQELPSYSEPFRRFSRPSNPFTPAARSVHQVMRQLEQMFEPRTTRIASLRDVVLLSLDLEYDIQKIHQIGVSTLDVRKITQVNTELPQSLLTMISNNLYLLQRNAIRVNKCQYRYGEPKLAKNLTIQEIFATLIGSSDKTDQPRNIVLLGHAIDNDILALKRCGFDITDIPNIVLIIDLAPIASYFLNDSSKFLSLKHVCQRLNIRRCGFHNAGHDALYTLQALLLLFSRYKLQKEAAAYIWSIPASKNDKEQALLWQCQVDAIQYVADQYGNVLWTGSPKQRRRREAWSVHQKKDSSEPPRLTASPPPNHINRSFDATTTKVS